MALDTDSDIYRSLLLHYLIFSETASRQNIIPAHNMLRFLIDENIPYIKGRLEPIGQVTYLDQNDFSHELASQADAVLIRTRTRANASLLENTPVRLVATATIGTDQIDIPWCDSHGITVRNSPGCNAPAVAQYVWSSLLHQDFNPEKDTLGIIGCGNVGGIVRQWGEQLGVRMMVCDPFRPDLHTSSLEEIMSQCDAVTLHTPLTRDGLHPTFHLINEKLLPLMKQDAILINAARGPVVDFNALREFSRIRPDIRMVIDTWEGEPAVDPEILEKAVYATPHIAGYSRLGKERATRMVLEAVEEEFGIEIDKSGLSGPYRPIPALTAEMIKSSYDPAEDTRTLRAHPSSLETLRHDYSYRPETGE